VDELTLSIGLGLAVSILFSETFGIAAGGMIVPGYLALHLDRPYDLLLTALASLITYGIVRSFSMFMIVFGRRRTVLMILVGYIVGAVVTQVSPSPPDGETIQVIGYIIPGLIAIWLDRQGVIETFSSAATAAILVKLIMITLTGFEVLP
jgi:poly-gamma-glutamate biosynthesis protein PgsC/CapC